MNLATIAAFTAAIISLFNVIVTARLARLSRLQQWRREEMRPVVARILTLSRQAADSWEDMALDQVLWLGIRDKDAEHAKVEKMQALEMRRWDQGHDSLKDLGFEVAQLDLIAHQSARDTAKELLRAHGHISSVLLRQHDEDASARATSDALQEFGTNRKQLENDLIQKARADLGLPTSNSWHPRFRG